MRFVRKPPDQKIDRGSERQKERQGGRQRSTSQTAQLQMPPENKRNSFPFLANCWQYFSNPSLSPPSPPPLTMHFQFSNFKRSTGRMINFIYLKANVQRSLPQLDCILSVVTGKWQVMASCNTLLPLAATQHNERMPRASSQRARLSAQMKSCGR